MTRLLKGKEAGEALTQKARQQVTELEKMGVTPTLLVIHVGEDPGNLSYEKGIEKRCTALGAAFRRLVLPSDLSEEDLLEVIRKANEDREIHGVLLFRPLPPHLDARRIENALLPEKDVDGMTDLSLAGVFAGREVGFSPCTAQACMEILDYYGIDCCGKHAVVIGRSLVVGKPAAMMLLSRNATVTICHTRTKDLPAIARSADILIAAAGKPKIIGKDYMRNGQVILDVGIHAAEGGKLCGDVDGEQAEGTAAALTPVPGGVGTVTSVVLVCHVIEAALRQTEKRFDDRSGTR